MKKPRSIVKLLQLLLDTEDRHSCHGMCSLIHYLYGYGVISSTEYWNLDEYIKKFESIYHRKACYPYYWKIGDWRPRDRWLKQRIKIEQAKNKKK